MKQTLYFATTILVLATLSCSKKETSLDSSAYTPLVITAVADDDITKTTYTDNGTMYEFSWNQNDYVSVQVFKGGDSAKPDKIKFIAQSDGATTTLAQSNNLFDLTSTHNVDGYSNKNYTLGNYAFYPHYAGNDNKELLYVRNSSVYNNVAGDGDSSTDYVKLYESFSYVSSNPTSVIPIIGKKESGDGTPNTVFKFRTVTGVLKISLKQIPSGATKLVLTSKNAEDKLSGEWLFAEDETYTNGIQMDTGCKNFTNKKIITFSNLSGLDTFTDFYVPIPVGSIHGLLVDIMKDDNTLLWRVSTDEVLTITRGVVSELPPINMSELSLVVSVSGISSNPGITVSKSTYGRVYCNFSTSDTNNPTDYPSGLYFGGNVTNYQLNTWNTGVGRLDADKRLTSATSGTCYIHYVVVKNTESLSSLQDKNVKAYGSIPFYFLSKEDKDAIEGNYVHATDASCKNENSPSDLPTTSNITLVEGSDPKVCDILISNVDDVDCSFRKPKGIWDGATTITFDREYMYSNPVSIGDGDAGNYKYLMNYASTGDFVIEFTSVAKTSLYVDLSQFGIQHHSGDWYYVYNAGSTHIYTKQ